MDVIDGLRRQLHRDPWSAADGAGALVACARDRGDDRLLARSLAVRGRARRALGDIDLAIADLTAALAAAERCGDPDLVGDAHVGLAGALTFAGRGTEALDHLERAEAQGTPRAVAYAALQRAAVHQINGRPAEALRHLDAALPGLHAVGDDVDVAMVLLNRGLLRTDAGDLAGAVADFDEAGALFAANGEEFHLARTSHNRGWASLRGGDLPAALAQLDDAIERYTALGGNALDAELDRAEVLLAAGLGQEALALAGDQATRLERSGDASHAAYAWLLAARAARLDGDGGTARACAERSCAMFEAQGATGYALAARTELLRTGAGERAGDDAELAELAELAAELDRNGSPIEAVRALAQAAAVAAARGDGDRAAAHAAECGARAERFGLVELRLEAAHALAAAATARADAAAARRHLRRGHRELERHRALLGTSDARAAVATHGAALLALGLRNAVRAGTVAEVFEWMERTRSGRSAPPPARPPADARLAADLMRLRAVAAAVRQRALDGEPPGDLVVRQRELEGRIHRHLLRQSPPAANRSAAGDRTAGVTRPGDPAIRPPSPRDVRAAAGRTVVSLAEVDGRLVAVVIGARRSRLVDAADAARVNAAADSVGAALRSLADRRVGTAGTGAAHRPPWTLLDRALAVLDGTIRPLAGATDAVVLVLPPRLHAVPWHMVPCLRGRAVTVAPSAAWLVRTAGSDRPCPAGPALAVAGPRLTEAEREVTDVAAVYRHATVLTGAAATVEAVSGALPSASTAHLAVHGRFRHDNPLWSTLELHDGPLPVYELESLPALPSTVVLAACDSGLGGRAGDSLLGLAAAVLAMGTRSLVASLCPLPDTPATREGMVDLHRRLAAGASPAEALAGAATGGDPTFVSSIAAFGR